MQLKLITLVTFLICVLHAHAQSDFTNEILGVEWSLEDTTQKDSDEYLLLTVESDSLTIFYMDWIEGAVGGGKCSYELIEHKKCYELVIGDCPNYEEMDLRYVYLYLNEDTSILNMILEKERITRLRRIRKRDDWFHMQEAP